jgi:hypothetical protein
MAEHCFLSSGIGTRAPLQGKIPLRLISELPMYVSMLNYTSQYIGEDAGCLAGCCALRIELKGTIF